ncbi:hypothetical protein [Streptomyces sp. XH2]|uniref:hypothetical protein n=1 Tax=Streptomyces sp. XH2 TaxID=3412483 RepID=UPI003C7ADDED
MPVVSSQGLPLDLSDRTLFAPGPMRDGAHLLGRPDGARERLAAEGCLYLRGVLDRAEVLRLREAYFAAGDVTAHLPRIVHASLDTRTPAMRLSVDVRFVRRGDRANPRRLRDRAGDDGF